MATMPTMPRRPALNFDAHAASEPLLRHGNIARRHLTSFWDGFVDFAFNDNVLHVAIGLMYVSPVIFNPLFAPPVIRTHT